MVQRNFVTHPLVVRKLSVKRVADITPRMRRITLCGPQLQAFSSADFDLPRFISTGFDDHIKLVLTSNGDITSALPVQRAHSIDWRDAPHRELRDYTPRRFDAEAGELDLDFVRHGEGPAALWAEAATPGAELHVVGPKSSLVLPDGVDWLILAGDETALPAIGRYLDERPGPQRVQVVVEIRDPAARQTLLLRDDDTLRWVDTPPASASRLATAVRELEWWDGSAYIWAAAESSMLMPLRRWAAKDRKLAKTHINITGYWHQPTDRAASVETLNASSLPAPVQGPTVGSHPPPSNQGTPVDIAALLSPVPWFATRAALSLGLLDAVADSPSSVDAIAAMLQLDSGQVRSVVDVLAGFGVLELNGDMVSLGYVGLEVLGDDHLRESFEDSLEARMLVSLTNLASALTTGIPAFRQTHGLSLLDELCTDAGRYAELIDQSMGFDFVARAVSDLAVIDAVRTGKTVAVTGPGTLAFADALSPEIPLGVVEAPSPLGVLRGTLRRAALDFRSSFADASASLAVSALALSYRTDQESVALLARMTVADSGLIVEKMPTHIGAGEADIASHEAEERLLALAGTGSPARTAQDIRALARTAGWIVTKSTPLGWDYEAFELVRQ